MISNRMKLISIILIICGFVFTSCNDGDDNPASIINHFPVIQSVTANPDTIYIDGTTSLSCVATDSDQDELTYTWFSQLGSFPNGLSGSSIQWIAPSDSGSYSITVTVSDGVDSDQDFVSVAVESVTEDNLPPATPSNPNPADNSTEVSTSLSLTWTSSDPDGDALTYDVYLGTSTTPSLVETVSSETYDPGTLEEEETYYWKIVADDANGGVTEGPVWSFTVEEGDWEPGDPPANPSHGDEWTAYVGEDQIPLMMVFIEGGSFRMGAQRDESYAGDDERPRHWVTISDGFWIGKYEVTQAQWLATAEYENFNWPSNPDRPAEMISHDDIMNDFLPELGNEWRLPTEAEWEFACRGGVNDEWFWWGNSYDIIGDYAWYRDNSNIGNGQETHDVGSKIPNPWGLYDMHGNVWEWCSDAYSHEYYTTAHVTDPENTSHGDIVRVKRGGRWDSDPEDCRAANRQYGSPSSRNFMIGFRLVRDAD